MIKLTVRVIVLSAMFFICAQEKASAFYSPDTGRWLNRDPIAEGGGINLYRVAGDNPINDTDPLGLSNPIGGSNAVGPESGLADPSFFAPSVPSIPPISFNPTPSLPSAFPLLTGQPTPQEQYQYPFDGGVSDLTADFVDVATLAVGGVARNAIENSAVKKCVARSVGRAAADKAESDLIGRRADLQNLIKTLHKELDAMKNRVAIVQNDGDPVPPSLFKQIQENQAILEKAQQQLMEDSQKL